MHYRKCGQAGHNSATCKHVSDFGVASPSHFAGTTKPTRKSATRAATNFGRNISRNVGTCAESSLHKGDSGTDIP